MPTTCCPRCLWSATSAAAQGELGDVRSLPFADASLGGVVAWLLAHAPGAEVERQVTAAGFDVVMWAWRPADPDELPPQGYLISRRRT